MMFEFREYARDMLKNKRLITIKTLMLKIWSSESVRWKSLLLYRVKNDLVEVVNFPVVIVYSWFTVLQGVVRCVRLILRPHIESMFVLRSFQRQQSDVITFALGPSSNIFDSLIAVLGSIIILPYVKYWMRKKTVKGLNGDLSDRLKF